MNVCENTFPRFNKSIGRSLYTQQRFHLTASNGHCGCSRKTDCYLSSKIIWFFKSFFFSLKDVYLSEITWEFQFLTGTDMNWTKKPKFSIPKTKINAPLTSVKNVAKSAFSATYRWISNDKIAVGPLDEARMEKRNSSKYGETFENFEELQTFTYCNILTATKN